MSANRGQAPSRRERERQSRRRERLTIAAIAAVLGVAAIIVVVGLVLTQYLPPRAHVLRVGDSDYTAGDVYARARYEISLQNPAVATLDVVVSGTLQEIEDGEVVLRRAPAVVGEASDDEVTAWLREQFGFEGEDDLEQFADALTATLRSIDISRDQYLQIATVRLLEERLTDQFREALEPEAEQLRLTRVRLADRGAADEVREQALDGEDLAGLARDSGVEAGEAAAGGDLGWLLLSALGEPVRAALAELEAGAISEVVDDPPFFDVYRVEEREQSRPLDEAQIEALVAEQLEAWIEEQREFVSVERDLSDGESEWISDRVLEWRNDSLSGLR